MHTAAKEERPSDEAILRYEEEIREAEVMNTPLISDCLPFSNILSEYEQAPGFLMPLLALTEQQPAGLRRLRRDGSCFYRALGFRLIELLPTAGETETVGLWNRIEGLLGKVGFERQVYEDFLTEFQSLVKTAPSPTTTTTTTGSIGDWLAGEWRAQEWRSNSVVVILRLLCSAYLRIHADEYEAFLMEQPVSNKQRPMEVFCQRQVECVGQEADQIHVIALSKALGVVIEIAQIEEECPLQSLAFGPSDDEFVSGVGTVHLLYRPGHYDLLYF